MALAPGTRIGSYEITALIGEGGMGKVWRAHHAALRRDDALKVLPDAFAADPDRLARFRREAQILASLNHPNIAHVYGLEQSNGVQALVMELVEGPTLADRIAQGPIPLDDALPIAKQIVEALEAAHDEGIIHRDLKPANIKVRPDGTVKVLDFGLAKAMEPTSTASTDATASPTITSPAMMTGAGVLLGTAAYMSPEQARGQPVDKRSDIWALGCVLYEMLTGHRPFAGAGVSDAIAAILRDQPDWSRLPGEMPASVRRVLRRCLEKDRRRRLADVRDARLDLEDAFADAEQPPQSSTTIKRWERLLWLGALVVTTGLAIRTARPATDAASSPRETRLEFSTAPTNDHTSLAVAPDGRKITFVAISEGRSLLWVYEFDTGKSHPIRGTDGASSPFWSPDGRAIAFFADEQLKRVNLDGSLPVTLAPGIVPAGGAWAPDGRIVYPLVPDSPLLIVAADRENQAPVLAPRPEPPDSPGRVDVGERFPQFLPDGRHYLYYVAESRSVFLGTLDGPERRRLFEADAAAVVAPPSEVLYVRNGVLYAQVLDTTRFALTGEPVPLATSIGVAAGAAPVAASATGTIVYRTGSVANDRQLLWFDRAGHRLAAAGDVDSLLPSNLNLSADGRRLALNRTVAGNADIYVMADVSRGIARRFTDATTPDIMPVWSPDGRTLLFSQAIPPLNRFALHVRPVEGDGEARAVLGATPLIQIAMDWKEDFLLYRTLENETGWDIWSARATGDARPQSVVRTRFHERNVQFSPDAAWVAYESNKSGTYEIYLRRFGRESEEMPVSKAGGTLPRWHPRGTEIFYLAPDGWLMSVEVTRPRADDITLGVPRRLFEMGAHAGSASYVYAVGPDGQRFLVSAFVDRPQAPISVILDRRR